MKLLLLLRLQLRETAVGLKTVDRDTAWLKRMTVQTVLQLPPVVWLLEWRMRMVKMMGVVPKLRPQVRLPGAETGTEMEVDGGGHGPDLHHAPAARGVDTVTIRMVTGTGGESSTGAVNVRRDSLPKEN